MHIRFEDGGCSRSGKHRKTGVDPKWNGGGRWQGIACLPCHKHSVRSKKAAMGGQLGGRLAMQDSDQSELAQTCN